MSLRSPTIPVSDPQAGLKITEIFCSLQGEARDSGRPTVFIRLTGCPLRCTYCDTEYAFEGGKRLTISDLIDQVKYYKTDHVCVTGGEPLAQPNCLVLLEELVQLGYSVSLETSGALDISHVNPRVSRVMDLKTPSSSEASKNHLANINQLTVHDQIKFVIADELDYHWAKDMVHTHQLTQKVGDIWFSPVFSTSSTLAEIPQLAMQLAQWILRDNLPVRLQLQLHKLLWHDAAGH